ncbi:MAG: hypothetical protein WDM80_19000 [Limisphaerales bacterium]
MQSYQWCVQLFKKILILLLVAVWSLAANHCKLEQLPGFQFLKCGEFAAASEHSGGDCTSDGCTVVESGFYKTEKTQPATTVSLLLQIPAVQISVAARASAGNIFVSHPAQPELPQCWQFAFRTASPPRAPSFAS